MDAYELLRKEAACKMDQAIKAARDEYKDAVAKINELRAALGYREPLGLRTKKTITQILKEHFPQDRPFTVSELITNCKAVYPSHRFKRSSVRSSMQRCKEDGLIRRIAKDQDGYILWAVAELDVETKPYGAMPLSDVIADVLERHGPLRPIEIAVAIRDLGVRADEEPAKLARAVSKSLGMNPRRFVRDEGGAGGWRVNHGHF